MADNRGLNYKQSTINKMKLNSALASVFEKLAVNNYRLLTKEEELELFKKYKLCNDQEAYTTIIYSNLRLIYNCALNYKRNKETTEDLVQEGYLGLIKAIEKFDHTLGYRFSTYATYCIKQSMRLFLSINEPFNYIPTQKKLKIDKLICEANKFLEKYGKFPSVEELALRMNISIEEVNTCLKNFYYSKVLYFDEEIESKLWIDNSEKQLLEMTQKLAIQKCFQILSPREIVILNLRFGLIDGKEYKLREIGEMFHLDYRYVGKIITSAFRKIKRNLDYSCDQGLEEANQVIPYQLLCQLEIPKKSKKKKRK